MTTVVQQVSAGPPCHRAGERSSASFLVRVWYEAREVAGGAPAFRGYIKNLQTGEESFVRDPAKMSEQILRQVRDETPAAAEGQEGARDDH